MIGFSVTGRGPTNTLLLMGCSGRHPPSPAWCSCPRCWTWVWCSTYTNWNIGHVLRQLALRKWKHHIRSEAKQEACPRAAETRERGHASAGRSLAWTSVFWKECSYQDTSRWQGTFEYGLHFRWFYWINIKTLGCEKSNIRNVLDHFPTLKLKSPHKILHLWLDLYLAV